MWRPASPPPTLAGKARKVTLYSGMDWPWSIATGPDGALWFSNEGNNSIGRIITTGTVTNYRDSSINSPTAIAAGPEPRRGSPTPSVTRSGG
jgi:virginiamycin B lyase